MDNNVILRRIRFIFDYDDAKMIALFAAADVTVTRAQVSDWLKGDDHSDFKACSDTDLAVFLNGMINDRRGRREGEQPKPESRINNNLVLVKLRIALNMRAEDILETLALADFRVSKHELSSFFRKPGNKHYRVCQDQMLRNFLMGAQLKYRPKATPEEVAAQG